MKSKISDQAVIDGGEKEIFKLNNNFEFQGSSSTTTPPSSSSETALVTQGFLMLNQRFFS